jgi:heme exporter protein C
MFGPKIDKYASPRHAYRLAECLLPWCTWSTVILFIVGLYWGLVIAPTDYEQGEAYRIIYIHVPAAYMSMSVYAMMAGAGAAGLIWKVKVTDAVAKCCAPLGASFTFLALITGSIWGKPMWGTWWTWDPRLTTELILLFLYLGYMSLQAAIEDRRTAARASAVLALVGVVNLPIIHYSVEWWNSLHQGPSVTTGAMHPSMLWPLLTMCLAFTMFFATALILRVRNEIIDMDRRTGWVGELVNGDING